MGVAAFITKFGMITFGYVAVQHSPLQITVRSAHTIVGMILWMTSVIHMIKVYRVGSKNINNELVEQIGNSISATEPLSVKGGLS